MKGETKQVGYFPKDSKDSVTWPNGYAEAAAQLADWVAEGCTDAKLFPLNDNAYYIPVTCKMTLVGTGHKYITVQVNEGAEVLLEGGEYENITVNGGEATIPDVICKGVTVNGGKATLRLQKDYLCGGGRSCRQQADQGAAAGDPRADGG